MNDELGSSGLVGEEHRGLIMRFLRR